MKMLTNQSRSKYLLIVAALGLLYLVVDGTTNGWKMDPWRLVHNSSFPAISSQSGNGTSTSQSTWPNTNDISNAVVNQVTRSVSNVSGLNDIVVLPDTKPGTYTVSAMVDLGDADENVPALWDRSVDDAVDTYFQDLFSNQFHVSEAEVYFTLDGNIVASAGLGADAYHEVATVADTGEGGLAAVLRSMHSDSTDDMNNHWLALKSMS